MRHLTFKYLADRQWSVLRARFFLRNATSVGRGIRMRGSAFVQNEGRLVVGDRVCFYTGPTAVELTTKAGGVLEIGDETHFNYGSSFNASASIRIGRRCLFGIGVTVMDSNLHGEAIDERYTSPEARAIEIEEDVWVASRAIILPGVTLGRGCIVGAGSVVTRSVPPGTLAIGNPARVVRAIKATDAAMRALEEAEQTTPPSGVFVQALEAPLPNGSRLEPATR